jgi:hypothetical protein
LSKVSLRAIAEQLRLLAEGEEGPEEASSSVLEPVYIVSLAEALYANRRARDLELPPELFGEPAWDILLDLFIQRARGNRVSMKHAWLASYVPEATSSRWIKSLEEAGLVRRDRDPDDQRRFFVSLTDKGNEAMTRFLTGAIRTFGMRKAPA